MSYFSNEQNTTFSTHPLPLLHLLLTPTKGITWLAGSLWQEVVEQTLHGSLFWTRHILLPIVFCPQLVTWLWPDLRGSYRYRKKKKKTCRMFSKHRLGHTSKHVWLLYKFLKWWIKATEIFSFWESKHMHTVFTF